MGDQPGQGGFDFQWGWGNQGEEFDLGFDDLGDMFENVFGFGYSGRQKDIKRGKSIEVDLEISLQDTLKGHEKKITLNKLLYCSRCQGSGGEPGTKTNQCFSCRGTGQVQQIKKTFLGSFTRLGICPECNGDGQKPEKPCNVCKGEGRVKGQETIKFFIPAGVDSNQVIKVEGKGEAGRKGGDPGDLYIRIFIKPHPVFQRKGDDLYVQSSISFSQAALGDKIKIPTLEGESVDLKIPSGIESGKIIQMSGKGVSRFSSYGRGNMYVKLIVKTPQKLTRKQKELLEKMKEEGI